MIGYDDYSKDNRSVKFLLTFIAICFVIATLGGRDWLMDQVLYVAGCFAALVYASDIEELVRRRRSAAIPESGSGTGGGVEQSEGEAGVAEGALILILKPLIMGIPLVAIGALLSALIQLVFHFFGALFSLGPGGRY